MRFTHLRLLGLLTAVLPLLHATLAAEVLLGSLTNVANHGLAGKVYAVNTRTLRIESFFYDGLGPAGVFWVDEGPAPTAAGLQAFEQPTCALQTSLPPFTGQDVLVELPPARLLSSVGYFSVWCVDIGVSFGGVHLDPAKISSVPDADPLCSTAGTPAPVEVEVGDLSDLAMHGIVGTVYAVNSRTLRLKGFSYDGKGPAAVFWVGKGATPDGNGLIPPQGPDCEVIKRLPAYSGAGFDLELPNNLTLSDIDYLSVWCEQVGVDFGNVRIDASALSNVPDLAAATCDSGPPGGQGEPFPVPDSWNCEPLNDDFQVRWVVNGGNVDVELVARIKKEQYMGFGPSGSDTKTDMIGSDVVIAYQNESDFFAVDYYMTTRDPCTAGSGVCPDEQLAPTRGSNDVSTVSGKREGDLTMIRYTRPLAASDANFDRPISTSESTFVSWAIGPLNPSSLLPLFHGETNYPKKSVEVKFGRPSSDNCPDKLLISNGDGNTVPGFKRPTISGVTGITARIGPPGGSRGYSGITGGPSWGFAWYMSPTGQNRTDVLIPAIAVERGRTYTFTVQGGVSDGTSKAFHPLYITSSAMGGFAVRSPQERANETIYAGIEDIVRDSDGGITDFKAPATGALCQITSSLTGDSATLQSWGDYAETLNTQCADDAAITSNSGQLTWTVPNDAPDVVFYQCVTHPFLGFKIAVFDEGKVDQDVLDNLSGGGELSDDAGDDNGANQECKVTFKGTERVFSQCKKALGGYIDVYWTRRDGDGEIDTLFRGRTEGGYVGFGWGYSSMVGSNVVIAFQDASGKVAIGDYFLESKSSAGVQPNDTQKLTKTDAEVDGRFVSGIFTRKLVSDGVPPIGNGSTDVIWALGTPPSDATSLSVHLSRGSALLNVAMPAPDDDTDEVCTVKFKGNEQAFEGCRNLTNMVEVYWRLREDDGEIDTLFRAPTKGGYVGFGWGYSNMVGSNVAIVFQEASGQARIRDYFMQAKSTGGVQPNNNQKLTKMDADVDGEFVTGVFTRKLAIDGLPTIINGKTDAIWAVGSRPTSATTLSQHSGRARGVIDISMRQNLSFRARSRYPTIFTVHGVLMAAAWFVLTPAAIVAMRFFKKYNPTTFQLHRAINGLSVLLVIAAFIMAVVEGSHTEKAHLAIGSIAFFLALCQVLSGALRPQKDNAVRRSWYILHRASGTIAQFLGIANVWIGLTIIDADVGFFVACGVLVGISVVAYLLLSFMPKRFPIREQDTRTSEEQPLAPAEEATSGNVEQEAI